MSRAARPALSLPQLSCLKEAAGGALIRQRAGYGANGWHAPRTVKSLAGRGLLKVNPIAGCMGTAGITRAGRDWLKATLGENA